MTKHATAERMVRVYVPGAGEIPPASAIGGKASNLARLAAAAREPGSPGFEVPRFVALPAALAAPPPDSEVLPTKVQLIARLGLLVNNPPPTTSELLS